MPFLKNTWPLTSAKEPNDIASLKSWKGGSLLKDSPRSMKCLQKVELATLAIWKLRQLESVSLESESSSQCVIIWYSEKENTTTSSRVVYKMNWNFSHSGDQSPYLLAPFSPLTVILSWFFPIFSDFLNRPGIWQKVMWFWKEVPCFCPGFFTGWFF